MTGDPLRFQSLPRIEWREKPNRPEPGAGRLYVYKGPRRAGYPSPRKTRHDYWAIALQAPLGEQYGKFYGFLGLRGVGLQASQGGHSLYRQQAGCKVLTWCAQMPDEPIELYWTIEVKPLCISILAIILPHHYIPLKDITTMSTDPDVSKTVSTKILPGSTPGKVFAPGTTSRKRLLGSKIIVCHVKSCVFEIRILVPIE